MTIRNQFVFLAISIISIPLLCFLYSGIDRYHKSEQRLLIQGYKEIHKLDSELFTKEGWDELFDFIQSLPPNIQTAIISEDNLVIASSIPGIKTAKTFSHKDIWEFIDNTPTNFFYQFTTFPISGKNLTMISRIPRDHHASQKKNNFFNSLLVFLLIIVVILVIYVVIIFRSIIKSITKITDKTHNIAEGNLEESIIIEDSSKTASNEIISITESLEKMRLSLIEAQQQKNKFIMGMSHDLRTPVAIIKGYTEALKDGIITEPEELTKTYDLISEKTNKLEEMINILINYTKLNTAEIRNNMIPQSITDLIKEFGKDAVITGQIFKRNVSFQMDFDENIKIPFDSQLISRALENILSNAIRYTNDNDDIAIIASKNEHEVNLQIKDTGCGIDEKDINNIFELFYRASNSRREEGMGIGLSVVKHIIDTHGWKISVESEKDIGTSFTITIPINQ